MRKLAIYPGSFDPITNGHVDIAKRASTLFDEVILAVAVNSKKQSLFSPEERVALMKRVFEGTENIKIDYFSGLTVDYCAKVGARAIIRGLRAVTDFDYEYSISHMNKKLAPDVETVFLMASGENSFLSSSIVKEISKYGRSVASHVPEIVNQALVEKFSKL